MNKADILMKESIEKILKEGHKDKNPRPRWHDGEPAYTLSINGQMHSYDISKNEFPITMLRPIYFKKAIGEILWIYRDGSNDLDKLAKDYDVHWWDDWDIGDRTIGECYGKTVENYNLLEKLLTGIINDPYGRRHIINLWQYADFENPHGLKPCCYQTQFLVRDEYIDMVMYQRSSDWLTAGNINEIQYVAFMMMVAKHCKYKPGVFYHVIANQQIYDRHVENAKIMLERYKELEKREIEGEILPQPILKFEPGDRTFWDYKVSDFSIENYEPIKPQLSFEVAV